MTDMYRYENELKDKGYKLVCGTDEAGAGPLAGPVFAAAVILKNDFKIDGLNDSKKLSEKKREYLYDIIKENALSYNIASVSETEIDEINILNARMEAMRRAVNGLSIKPDFLLIDGNRNPDALKDSLCIVGGDAASASVAAASILAKVSRDRLMKELDNAYPGYGFAKHKGYGTKEHIEALKRLGPCKIHRLTFLKNIL